MWKLTRSWEDKFFLSFRIFCSDLSISWNSWFKADLSIVLTLGPFFCGISWLDKNYLIDSFLLFFEFDKLVMLEWWLCSLLFGFWDVDRLLRRPWHPLSQRFLWMSIQSWTGKCGTIILPSFCTIQAQFSLLQVLQSFFDPEVISSKAWYQISAHNLCLTYSVGLTSV